MAPAPKPWGWIATFAAVGLVVVGVIVYAVWPRSGASTPTGNEVTAIAGVVDYRSSDPGSLTRNHKQGSLSYKTSPPVGGDHNPVWQSCTGVVYAQQIPNENAVHSLEHGAVWITYQPGLAADQIAKLPAKVQGRDYMLMSPYPGLNTPISLQAWGYQLPIDFANDARIDEFITATRIKTAPEPGATCSGGNTTTGTTPGAGPGMPQATS